MAAKAKGKEPEVTLARLFTELEVARQEESYEKGLRIIEKILSLSPSDEEAPHCKLVCLIQLDRIQDALKYIDSLNKKTGRADYGFEKAYCLYRQEKYVESRALLREQSREEPRVRELLAQIAYRLEDYDEARNIYSGLVRECSDDFSSEREANLMAAMSLSSTGIEASELGSLSVTTMEQCFNQACCFITLGRGEEAEKMLHRAEDLCRQTLQEEDYTEEEIESELAVVHVQLGFVLQMQHKSKEALGLYSQLLRQKPSDVSHAVIASNNIIVLNRDRDIFDSKKKIKILANEGSSKKLTRLQKMTVLFNRCLFALQTNQLEQCRQLVSELNATYPGCELATLAEAALLHREKKSTACLKLVETQLAKQETVPSFSLRFTLAQLHLMQGSTANVCKVLQSIPDLPKRLGVVGVLVSLYTNLGRIEEAIDVLDRAVVYWSKQQATESVVQIQQSVMMANARYKLQHGKPAAAAAVLEKLHAVAPAPQVVSTLVLAYSQFNSKKAEEVSHSLPPMPDIADVNVDTLEQMPSFRHSRRQVQKPSTDEGKKEFVLKEKKHKKKRKQKLPKNYDPLETPDPERWIPLRERSYYRKGKRKGFLPSMRGTQGTSSASAALAEKLDASKPKQTTQEPASPKSKSEGAGVSSPRPKAQPASSKKKPQQGKKKKKGGKW